MKLDLNCDLGEGEALLRTRALMRCITSANVACGGHAGDLPTMEACAQLAKRFGVRLGAHPGPWSRGDFGRGPIEISNDGLELLLLQQIGALDRIARRHGLGLHHIKLHGGLYHASEESEALGRRYVATVRRWWPKCILYVRADGRVARLARHAGLSAWEEAFADRNYQDDGALVSRVEPNALVSDVGEFRKRLQRLAASGEVEAISGRTLRLRPQTLCVHSDTPDALRLARAAAQILGVEE